MGVCTSLENTYIIIIFLSTLYKFDATCDKFLGSIHLGKSVNKKYGFKNNYNVNSTSLPQFEFCPQISPLSSTPFHVSFILEKNYNYIRYNTVDIERGYIEKV